LLVHDAHAHEARVIGPRTIELESPGRERYRFTEGPDGGVAYMLALRDGQARYRNDARRTPPSTLDPAYEGTYDVLVWGVPMGRYRLAQDGATPVIVKLSDAYGDGSDIEIALRLAPIGPGLYLSSM